jgi:predicted helicase
MEQSTTIGQSKPGLVGRRPGKKKTPSNLTQGIHQKDVHHLNGLDEYFQILPVVESFLNETNPQLKKSNGIFFTPYPVVSFIVRSIHTILKKKLGKPLGLADEAVKILDPAAGTGIFLIAAARLAIDEMARKYGKEKAHTLARQYMLNNLYGIEKEMFLYVLSCLELAHFFQSLNMRLKADERFHLYCSDALENRTGNVQFSVILGNPPYSGHSSNKGQWISEKIRDYYPHNEKNLKWLQDDYVKFIRFAQEKIEENGEGVVGFITNNAYLDNPTFRGMRQSLLSSFDEIFILNLHGNARKKEKCPDGSKDENIFNIRQGVAITFFIKKKSREKDCRVFYSDVWGSRDYKFCFLNLANFDTMESDQ